MWSAGVCMNLLASACTAVADVTITYQVLFVSLVFLFVAQPHFSLSFLLEMAAHVKVPVAPVRVKQPSMLFFSFSLRNSDQVAEKNLKCSSFLLRCDAAAALRDPWQSWRCHPSVRPFVRLPALLIFHAPAGTEHVQSHGRFVGPLCTCLVTFWLRRQIRTRLRWRSGEEEGCWLRESGRWLGWDGGRRGSAWVGGLLCLRRCNVASWVLCHRRESALLWFASRRRPRLRQLVCCSCRLISTGPCRAWGGTFLAFPLRVIYGIYCDTYLSSKPLSC